MALQHHHELGNGQAGIVRKVGGVDIPSKNTEVSRPLTLNADAPDGKYQDIFSSSTVFSLSLSIVLSKQFLRTLRLEAHTFQDSLCEQ